jgi:hypothetical protein
MLITGRRHAFGLSRPLEDWINTWAGTPRMFFEPAGLTEDTDPVTAFVVVDKTRPEDPSVGVHPLDEEWAKFPAGADQQPHLYPQLINEVLQAAAQLTP